MAATTQLAPAALLLRLLVPFAAAVLAAWALDASCRRRGLLPPGFRAPWRRRTAFVLVVAILWVAVFRPLEEVGLELKLDLSHVSTPQLFALHVMMAIAILGWFALGFAGVRPPSAGQSKRSPVASQSERPPVASQGERPAPPPPSPPVPLLSTDGEPAPAFGGPGQALAGGGPEQALAGGQPEQAPPPPFRLGRQLVSQLGLRAASVPSEVTIGLVAGLLAWGVVLAALLALALAVWAVGGERALPKPSAIVPWIAALPVVIRLMVSLSAGVVEETFFRGFLQPRIGITLSTAFFVLAHVSYGQPLMLVGITLLSLIFAFLVRWRQTIWPAIAAHALFDGIQLLVIIPIALRMLGQSAAGKSALAAAWPALCRAARALAGI